MTKRWSANEFRSHWIPKYTGQKIFWKSTQKNVCLTVRVSNSVPGGPEPWAISQYQVRKVRTCVLGSSDFAISTRECELPRTGGHKSGNSANGTAVYLITSARLSYLHFITIRRNISNTTASFCFHVNILIAAKM